MTATIARGIVDEVLSRSMTREIWTGNYDKALPVSVQDFDLSAVLPAVFYMFRFGHRRGKGKFLETFISNTGSAKERRQAATIERVASRLAENDKFVGFDGEAEQAILGDLLLCFCLENAKRALGRKEQVQRVAPAHYMASWVDLPDRVAHLRYVPEMIVAMLANQKHDDIQQNHDGDRTWFAVGRGFENNVLMRAFHQGVIRRDGLGSLAGRTSDQFEEETSVGLDQLLMIRLAQQLGAAPDKLRGKEGHGISNQRPIAEKAAQDFSEDIRRFVRSYADIIPRHAFVELLESCIAIGMTTILTSAIEILFEWAETGEIRKNGEQGPTCLFVDCSNGVDRRLRTLAEQSLDDFMRRIERFPVILMVLRLLDRGAQYDPKIKGLDIPTRPYATTWLNMLGELLHNRRAEAQLILYDLARKAEELAEKLQQEDYPEAAQMLRNAERQPNPVWRLAESLTSLQGRKNTYGNMVSLIDSALLIGRPNGLALKRTAMRDVAVTGTRKRSEIRSLVFTDSVLDYLVHLHVLPSGNRRGVRPLSFKEFIHKLHDRYGFSVDVAPPGMTISNDLLQANRAILERRLRDLGLLVGVNDAEAMKRLRSRFEPATED
jgi:hypothetical protein